eukprot:3845160-Prymnesium_polylepis.1
MGACRLGPILSPSARPRVDEVRPLSGALVPWYGVRMHVSPTRKARMDGVAQTRLGSWIRAQAVSREPRAVTHVKLSFRLRYPLGLMGLMGPPADP